MEKNDRGWLYALPYVSIGLIVLALIVNFFGVPQGVYLIFVGAFVSGINFSVANWSYLKSMFRFLLWLTPIFGLLGYVHAGYLINTTTGLMSSSYPFTVAIVTPMSGLFFWILASAIFMIPKVFFYGFFAFRESIGFRNQIGYLSQAFGVLFLILVLAEVEGVLKKIGYLNRAWVANILYYADYQDVPTFPCAISLQRVVMHGEDVVSFAEKSGDTVNFRAEKLSKLCRASK